MAKGAGMLAPALATMLVRAHHRRGGRRRRCSTPRCARPPGSPSTGSTPTAACPPTTRCCCWPAARPASSRPPAELTAAVTAACHDLAQQLLADAEGATKQIAIDVVGAADEDDAVEVGRAVARNNLVKTALFGNDPNWGRILAAVGTTAAAFEPDEVDVAVNGVWVCRGGAAAEDRSKVDLTGRDVTIRIDLHAGGDGGDDLDQRPVARVRARELGVLDMSLSTDLTRAQGKAGDADRGAALAGALPRRHGRGQVRRQRHDRPELQRAFAADMVFLRYAGLKPVVVHGGGPQISRDARPARHRQRVPRRPAGHHRRRRWTWSGWCWSARSAASWSA